MSHFSDPLRLAMAQINFRIGDLEQNAEKIGQAIDRARNQGADLIAFSEIALLGYPPRDMVHRTRLLERQWEVLDELAAKTDDDMGAIIGFVGRNNTDVGHRLYNGAAFCHAGGVTHRVAKQLLPAYDVFSERRYFHPRPSTGTVDFKGVRIGISICEDAWARVQTSQMPAYGIDPIARLVDDEDARILVNIAASPFSLHKGEFRRNLLAEHCRRLDRPMIFVNQIGGNDELIFDGRSMAIDANGTVRARLAEFDDDFQIVDVDADGTIDSHADQPLRPVANTAAAQTRTAVETGIRDYVRKSNFDSVIIGLSGGIDSSVTAALATEALGADQVRAVAMPSRFSSDHSREDARQVAQNLGIEFDEISIESAYDTMLETLRPHFGEDSQFGVTEENLQARIRGVYLMALSNKTGSLILACGNKSELAVGYTTLYGDMCGALAVIGDVPKMLVYDVARHFNEGAASTIIPERVLTKAPSAELRPGQKDEDSLPAYERLDEILERYIVDHQSIEEITEAGFDEPTVQQVVAGLHRNEYKRWQSAPVLKITDKAFGMGWRYPLAASYQW